MPVRVLQQVRDDDRGHRLPRPHQPSAARFDRLQETRTLVAQRLVLHRADHCLAVVDDLIGALLEPPPARSRIRWVQQRRDDFAARHPQQRQPSSFATRTGASMSTLTPCQLPG